MLQSQLDDKSRKLHWVTWIIALLSIFLIIIIASAPGSVLAFDSEPVENFGIGWTLIDEKGNRLTEEPLSLPIKTNIEETLRIEKKIPVGVKYPAVLGFRTAHQKVKMYCDGILLYSFGYEEMPAIGKSPGNAFNIVRLPKEADGKTLVLELTSPYAFYAGNVGDIYVGSKVALVFFQLRSHTFSFVITLAIFMIGLVTLIIDFLIIRKQTDIGKEMFYLGWFAVFVSLWMFGEGQLTQFFGVPPAVNTCFVFISMMVTPIPLVKYIACGCAKERQRLLTMVSGILCGLFVTSVLMQLIGIADFLEQLKMIHSIFAIAGVIIFYAVIYEIVKYERKNLIGLAISLATLIICFLLETLTIYIGDKSIGRIMRVGVLIFIAMQARVAFTNTTHLLKMSRLATVDALTGCFNRTAYIQKLSDLEGQLDVGVVIADINLLKTINDTFGHESGDDAIVRCSNCFKHAFHSAGNCYRIGGDEFIMIGKGLSVEKLQNMGQNFEQIIEVEKAKVSYPFAVAFGVAVFEPQIDVTIAHVVARADQEMYSRKRGSKEALKI